MIKVNLMAAFSYGYRQPRRRGKTSLSQNTVEAVIKPCPVESTKAKY